MAFAEEVEELSGEVASPEVPDDLLLMEVKVTKAREDVRDM